MPANNTTWKIASGLIGLLISVALVAGLLSFVSLDDFNGVLGQTDWWFVAAAAMVYFLTYVIRSYRFAVIIHEQSIVFFDHLMIVSIHTLFNHILPFRSGELSYIYLRKKINGLSYATATSSLLTARLFDVIGLVAVVLLLGIFFLYESQLNQPAIVSVSIVIIVAAMLFVFILKKFAARLWNEGRGRSSPQTRLQKVSAFITTVLRDMYSQLTLSRFLLLLGVTLANWASTFIYFYLLFCGFRSALTFRETLVPSLGAILGNLLPVNGLGSLGTFEAGLSAGQAFSGVDLTTSATVSFLIHFHAIVVGVVFAVLLSGSHFFIKSKLQNM